MNSVSDMMRPVMYSSPGYKPIAHIATTQTARPYSE